MRNVTPEQVAMAEQHRRGELPARVNRTINLVVATLYIPVSMYNAVGESWTYFYGLSIGLEVLLLAFILRAAWTWARTSSSRHATAS